MEVIRAGVLKGVDEVFGLHLTAAHGQLRRVQRRSHLGHGPF